MNKETMQAFDFKKKPYATPEIQVYAVEDEDIICTSGDSGVATQNEEYEVKSTSGWFGS